jgi:muconolactone delta-isomerase
MLFLVWFRVEQPESMTQKQIYEIWVRESKEASKVIKRESVVGLYKVSGKHDVLAILDFESHQALDRALSQLTLLKEVGHSLEVEITPVYPYGDFVQYAERALKENLV